MNALPSLASGRRIELAGAPPGIDARAIAEIVGQGRVVLHVAREASRSAQLVEALGFFAPAIEVLEFPAWGCRPYDRVSPVGEVVSRRIATLARLA
ncbi:MAG: hypothetical protein ACKOUS_16000, partial [Alphaproteobacteria bacterium]